MTITPTTLNGAIEAIDSEVAVLNERRRRLAELLATFTTDSGWVHIERTPDPKLNEQFALVDAEPAKPAPKPKPSAKGRQLRKWDYAEVAAVITQGVEAGKHASHALIDHYGVNKGMAAFLMKRCREQGYIADSKPFTTAPIERAPFDPQAARDAVAGPPTGAVRPMFEMPLAAAKAAPAEPAPKFTTEDALSILEAS